MSNCTFILKASLLPLLASLALAASLALPGRAHALSQEEAEAILQDTFTISGYMNLNGEKDYASKPGNVVAAALFGAFDASMERNYEQERRKEAGEKPIPGDAPIFAIAGRSLAPGDVVRRDGSPARFKGRPEQFNVFVSRKGAEVCALRYTGREIKQHTPPTSGMLADTVMTDEGYFACIDGLGDLPQEAVLKKVEPKGSGFVLTGELVESMGEPEPGAKPVLFKLVLAPGDQPGTWKRQFSLNSK